MNQGTRFLNKVAVVTSSSKGIGLATAKRLAKEGAKVMISSRNEDNVNKAVIQLVEEGLHDVHGMTCHVGEQEQTTDSEFDKMMDINLKAPFNMIKEAFPFLEQRPDPVDNARVAGKHNIQKGWGESSKFDSRNAEEKCTLQWKWNRHVLLKQRSTAHVNEGPGSNPGRHSDIRINCVLPGPIDTEFYGWVDKEIKAVVPDFDVKKLIPVKRLGTPDEVASTMAFLASDDASFITGENFVVAGGMPSRL
ncbi:hypothetical protein CAPTEDRAFT_202638 [Capitella teleta]|uniref:Dehydrogenase/reductase SDR family member 4 n=1 Tax=Capitella teleta TaxID=283909 RepID=R7V2Q9_CAPTE|nr:hypothetical protein CAPTEDRAFT_202638 [Capitella teleta]|eukprot:ELU10611.1 hypothetical protein CAPTEDRAFT_202638 [Capitella teleta]